MKKQFGKMTGMVCAVLLAAAMMTACGGEGAAGQVQESSVQESNARAEGGAQEGTVPAEPEEGSKAEPAANGETPSADAAGKEGTSGQSAFYDGADLEGNVAELTPDGFSLLPAQVWEEDDGEMMAAPAPGAEAETVAVVYTADTVFETAHMDLAAAAETGRETTEKDSVSAGDSVCVFGTQNEDGSWTAGKILILDWQ